MTAAGEWADGLPDGPDEHAGLAGADRDRGDRLKKSPSAFRTISEVADDLHIPQHVLRFWETRFPQVKPLKRGGGRRYYRPDDIVLLRRISELLYIQGYTIKGVQRLLREGDGTLRDVPALPAAVAAGEAESAEADHPGEPEAFTEPTPVEPAAVLPEPAAEPVVEAVGDEPQPAEGFEAEWVAEAERGSDPVRAALDENRRLREMLHGVLEELRTLRGRIPF